MASLTEFAYDLRRLDSEKVIPKLGGITMVDV